jgi:type III pantothenate kinase
MILCVDVGNTATKMALVAGERVVRRGVIDADAGERAAARLLARVVRGSRRLETAVLSSVRPQATDAMVRVVVRATGLYPIVVNHRTPMPIEIAVRYPGRVGTDRLCAACGAMRGRRRDAIVITVGSAITVNLIRDRVFVGGVIMPGPATSLAALHAFTAKLPALGIDAPAPARIDDTESAMRWGALLAGAGGIRLAVEMLDRQARSHPARIVTGGDSTRIQRWLPSGWSMDPDLTVLGMARIARTDSAK